MADLAPFLTQEMAAAGDRAVAQRGYNLVAMAATTEPHLWIVMGRRGDAADDYAVWTLNTQTDELIFGHYAVTHPQAARRFSRKLLDACPWNDED
jgi:hypothetical protein